MEKIKFIFFGGEPLSVPILNKLYEKGLLPEVIVCNPDRPQGRKMEITPPPTKVWALENNIPVLQPEKLTFSVFEAISNCDLFIVVSYGKIIPKDILEIPKHGAINVHPSLLPKYRGPSPIVSPILNGDSVTGATIIVLDEQMDHGPILAQKKIPLSGDESIEELEKSLANIGAELLIEVLPDFADGKIRPVPQNESLVTFCKKIKKEDGLINPSESEEQKYNKFRAYATWPRTFFFQDGKRIIITDAIFEDGEFVIKKVIPEGGKEQEYKIIS